jgi:hypothetical protein
MDTAAVAAADRVVGVEKRKDSVACTRPFVGLPTVAAAGLVGRVDLPVVVGGFHVLGRVSSLLLISINYALRTL